ncbi:NAD(P)H-dependent glycerol-3-phosphate dehydrogenase, partial [Corynebacterium durum]
MVKVAVMGAGSWGTTLAKVFADAGNSVVLWVRREAVARKIQISRENEKYLPGLILPRGIAATSDPLVALSDADIVVLAVPSQTLRENLARWKDDIPADATLVSLAKGIERDTHLRMTQVVAEVAQVDPSRIAVLSGPNLAREVALEQPAATVIACTD